ncbi:hypothetical protein [Dankookia sp. P2]|uniref:hypothetical protein n=1 Tax=Dankookia sp. P2 TaxID=3423955 RepID=UPI003D674EB5
MKLPDNNQAQGKRRFMLRRRAAFATAGAASLIRPAAAAIDPGPLACAVQPEDAGQDPWRRRRHRLRRQSAYIAAKVADRSLTSAEFIIRLASSR